MEGGNDASKNTTEDEPTAISTNKGRNGKMTLRCGDFCCKIPALLLRNIFIPRDEWYKFPNGFRQEQMVFHPRTDSWAEATYNPEYLEIKDEYEEIFFNTKDKVMLHAYLIKCTSPYCPSRSSFNPDSQDNAACEELSEEIMQDIPPGLYSTLPTIIFFHGNRGCIGSSCARIKLYKRNPILAKVNWFLVEYRGYGKSEGKEEEKGLYEDGKAAFDYIESRQDLDPRKIIVMGHSLGGAIAIHTASRPRYRNRVAALITENTFTTIPEMARKLYPQRIITTLPNCFYSCKFSSIAKVRKVKCPSVFICSIEDEYIPCEMSVSLYEKCGATVKYLEKLECGGHSDTFTTSDYMPRLAKFMMEVQTILEV